MKKKLLGQKVDLIFLFISIFLIFISHMLNLIFFQILSLHGILLIFYNEI
jgi:hypothetical protein